MKINFSSQNFGLSELITLHHDKCGMTSHENQWYLQANMNSIDFDQPEEKAWILRVLKHASENQSDITYSNYYRVM